MKRSTWMVVAVACGLVGASGAASAVPMLHFPSNTRVEMAQNLYPSLSNLTISVWIRSAARPSSGQYAAIAGRGHLTPNNGFGLFLGGDGKLYFQTRYGGTQVNAITDYPFDSAWHHVAGVRESHATRLYLDGILTHEATGALASLYTSGVAFALGMRQSGGTWSYPFSGSLSDVQLWDHARSAEQIFADMFRRPVGTETGLAGYWPLSEGGGTTAIDRTLAANNGTCVNTFWSSDVVLGAMLSMDSNYLGNWPFTLADWETGSTRVTDSNEVAVVSFPVPAGYDAYQIGTSAEAHAVTNGWVSADSLPAQACLDSAVGRVSLYAWFTNTAANVPLRRSTALIMLFPEEAVLDFKAQAQNRVGMATNLYAGLANLTVSAWVKAKGRPSSGSFAAIAGRGYLADKNGFGLFLDGEGNAVFQARTGGLVLQPTATFPFDDQWHHLAGVREGNTARLYLDGSLATETTGSLGSLFSAGIFFGIGASHDGTNWRFPFDGLIAEVRLWDHARTQAQIQSGMFRCLAGVEVGLIGYWPLAEGADTTVTDRTDAGNNGSVTNGAAWLTEPRSVALLPASRDPSREGAWPLILTDSKSGSKVLTASNVVSVSAFPIPFGYDQYRISAASVSQALGAGEWLPTDAVPGMLSLGDPVPGQWAVRYAWFTNTTDVAAPLRRSGAAIIHATNTPALDVTAATAVARMAGGYSGLTNLTLSAWVKTSVVPPPNQYGAIAGRGFLAADVSGFGLFVDFNGAVVFQTRNRDITNIVASVTYPFDGQWHHVAGVREGDVTRLYLDGELAAEATSAVATLDSNVAFGVGMRQAGNGGWGFPLNGAIAEVRLWNRARSLEEIRSDRYYRLTGAEPGLIGYWPLDECEGYVARDRSLTANNGTLYDCAWDFSGVFMRERPPAGLMIRVR